MANEPERLRCALFPARRALTTDLGPNPDGWGIGLHQGGEVLLQKRPKASPGVIDFYAYLRELKSDVVIAHVRTATVGVPQHMENTHPFRHRAWLFAQSGTVDKFAEIQERLLASVPDFLRRNIRGTTDAEHVFHLFLAFLHDAGQLEAPEVPLDALRNAMRQTALLLDRLCGEAGGAPARLNLAATNGRTMVALRRGAAMSMCKLRGIAECPVCRPIDPAGRPVANHHRRAVRLHPHLDPPNRGAAAGRGGANPHA
jgi:glutamine amidotransferase